jgi:hypothetical protein
MLLFLRRHLSVIRYVFLNFKLDEMYKRVENALVFEIDKYSLFIPWESLDETTLYPSETLDQNTFRPRIFYRMICKKIGR